MSRCTDDGDRGSCDGRDDLAIRRLVKGLRADSGVLEPRVEVDLRVCAEMALLHGRQIGLSSLDAFDALAAICLVVGKRRGEFFENVFLKRMMQNPNLTPRDKLNRLVEVVIATVPRPTPCVPDDTSMLESA